MRKPKQADNEQKAVQGPKIEFALLPSANAAAVIMDYGKAFGETSFSELTAALRLSMEDLQNDDMERAECMLLAQAHALQSIFTNLSRRAYTAEYLNNYEVFLRLALKAQNQCRMTLETLATIKNPPVVYARQANISHGPQQVNNGAAGNPATRAEETKTTPNELLETQYGERLEPGKTTETSPGNKTMGTMETVNRAENA